MAYKILWTEEAIKNLSDTLEYLEYKWSLREVNSFKSSLSKQLDLIANFPNLFPKSNQSPRLRKAVLSKQTTIFYEVNENAIFIVYLFANKKDPKSIQ